MAQMAFPLNSLTERIIQKAPHWRKKADVPPQSQEHREVTSLIPTDPGIHSTVS